MEHDHSVEAIQERLSGGPQHNYLRDWIYGGIDGSVTTFAVVSGVLGAHLSQITRSTFCNRAMLTSAGLMISATAVSSQKNQQQTLLAYPLMKIDGAERVMPGS